MGIARAFAGDHIPPKCHVIEVRIAELRQLFNAIDPSPFHERDLDPQRAIRCLQTRTRTITPRSNGNSGEAQSSERCRISSAHTACARLGRLGARNAMPQASDCLGELPEPQDRAGSGGTDQPVAGG
jgi:hypothetical protein